ncbi:hypothetical protein JCM3770_005222 [Rhodotorula araucariae]
MASWELSPLYRHAHSVLVADSHRLATLHRDRVVLRALDTLQVLRTWALPLASAHSLAAAPAPPHYLLVAAPRAHTAFVLDPDQDGVYARLDVGNEGAEAVQWAQLGPAGEAVVMSWSAHHARSTSPRMRLSLFRLADPANGLHILNPKHVAAGYAFRPDGAFLAVLERHYSRDVVGVYSTTAWALVRSIPLQDPNSDLADLSWSPCGRYIAAWSAVTDYILHILTPDGRLLSTYTPYASLSPPTPSTTTSSTARAPRRKLAAVGPAPAPPSQMSAHDAARTERSTASFVGLGIRCVRWAPSGECVAVGGWDGRIRVLSRHAWKAVAELGLPNRVVEPVTVWREPLGWVEKTRGKGIVSFDLATLPHSLTPLPPNFAAPVPRMGVAKLEWSPSGRWIAAWDAAHPHLIAIYAFPLPSLEGAAPPSRPALHTILSHAAPPPSSSTPSSQGTIRTFAWQPPVAKDEGDGDETLVMLSGEKGFTLWRTLAAGGGVAECVGIPAPADVPFPASTLAFAPDGRAALLSAPSTAAKDGEGTFCVAYPVDDAIDGAEADGGAAGRTWLSEEADLGA